MVVLGGGGRNLAALAAAGRGVVEEERIADDVDADLKAILEPQLLEDMSHVLLPYVFVLFVEIGSAVTAIVRGKAIEFKPNHAPAAYDFRRISHHAARFAKKRGLA